MKNLLILLVITIGIYSCENSNDANSTSLAAPQTAAVSEAEMGLVIQYGKISSEMLNADHSVDIIAIYEEDCVSDYSIRNVFHLQSSDDVNDITEDSPICVLGSQNDNIQDVIDVYEVLCQVEFDTSGRGDISSYSMFIEKNGRYLEAEPMEYYWVEKAE